MGVVSGVGPGAYPRPPRAKALALPLSYIPGHGDALKGLWKVGTKKFMVIFVTRLYSLGRSWEVVSFLRGTGH